MSQETHWRCDGCGTESATRKIDELRWVKITIAPRKSAPLLAADFELCPSCQVRLLTSADPRAWLRNIPS